MWAFISEKRNYKCASCGHLFRAHESICEDWRQPGKSFLCPSCKAYLDVPDHENMDRIYWCFAPMIPATGLALYYSQYAIFPVALLICMGFTMFFVPDYTSTIKTRVIEPE